MSGPTYLWARGAGGHLTHLIDQDSPRPYVAICGYRPKTRTAKSTAWYVATGTRSLCKKCEAAMVKPESDGEGIEEET